MSTWSGLNTKQVSVLLGRPSLRTSPRTTSMLSTASNSNPLRRSWRTLMEMHCLNLWVMITLRCQLWNSDYLTLNNRLSICLDSAGLSHNPIYSLSMNALRGRPKRLIISSKLCVISNNTYKLKLKRTKCWSKIIRLKLKNFFKWMKLLEQRWVTSIKRYNN
jgi:hypothetical protein